MHAPDLHHLTRLVYESVIEPSKWNQAMWAIADSFDAGHVLVGMKRVGEGPEYFSARVDDHHLRSFWDALEQSEFRDFPSWMPTGVFVASASVLDPRTYVRTEFYQGIVRPMGGHHAFLGMPFRMQDEQCFIAVCRSDRQGPFANGRLTQIQMLMPHFQSALRLQRRLAGTEMGLWHRESILDHLDVGVVLLDKRQRPLVANRKAREIFGLRKEMSLGREGLQSNASALTRTLQRMVGEAIQADSLAHETLWLRVERPGSTPLLLRVVPVSEADDCICVAERGSRCVCRHGRSRSAVNGPAAFVVRFLCA